MSARFLPVVNTLIDIPLGLYSPKDLLLSTKLLSLTKEILGRD
jgi:hypothetical protein